MTGRTTIDAGLAGGGALGLPEALTAGLFDLDGVLTNTAGAHDKAWKEMFDAFLWERAERTGQPFDAFDPVADYATYVDCNGRPPLPVTGVPDLLLAGSGELHAGRQDVRRPAAGQE